MTSERLDTAALTRRPHGPEWRRFHAEAVAGVHGEDLAGASWWRRARLPLLLLMFGAAAVAFPAIIISTAGHGLAAILGSTALSAGCVVAAVLVSAVDIFSYGRHRRHHDHFRVPGRHGFVIANYGCDPAPDDSETGRDNWGYAVFTLRDSYPHTLLSRRRWPLGTPRGFRDIAPVQGPGGLQMLCTKPDYPLLRTLLASGVVDRARGPNPVAIEIVGDELFLIAGKSLPLHSPRLWRQMESVAEALAPLLKASAP